VFTSSLGGVRRRRTSLRARIAGAGLVATLVAASALVIAPPASAAELPFAVSSPQNGSAVSSTTPVFAGTGTTGDTVTLTYSGQQLGGYVAGTTTVDDAGNWSTPTSFTKANPGETETRVRVTATTSDGAERDTFFITVTFPQAPVPAAVFTLESPVDGETRNDFLNIVHFVGEGNVGNTVTVRYFDGRGGLAVAGEATVGQNGRYDVFATFRDLPAGQTFANTFTVQTTPSGDRVSNEIGRTIFFAQAPVEANPFVVTSPANGATVDTASPAFTGTGAPGDTVRLTFGGQRLGTYTAGTTTIGDNGTWSIPTTDFSDANFGETSIRVLAAAYDAAGNERRGASFITINFAEAPVAVTEFTLTSPVEGETRNDLLNIVHFIGTGEPGNTVYVEYFDGRGGLARAGETEVRADGTFDVFATFRDLPAGQTFANTFTQQADPEGNLVAREIARNINFAVAPVEATPFTVTSPQQGETVDSITPEFTGTGTPGDTVLLTYGGQGLQTYTAGTATVDADGEWVVPTTDFSKANFGETEIRVSAAAYAPSGELRPGSRFVDIVLPEAPAEQIDFTLTTPEEGDTIADPRPGVPFLGTGEPGNTIVVQYFKAGGGLAEAGRTTVDPDGSFAVNAFFTEVGADGNFANTFTQQLDAAGNRVANEIARLIYFEISPVVEALPAPTLDEPVVNGSTVAFSGTGVSGATVEVAVTDAGLAQPSARALVAPTTLSAVVEADGTWSVAADFEPGEYSAIATQFTGDGADRSAPTPAVSFEVVAVVTPPTGPTDPGAGLPATPAGGNPAASGGSLPATGADSSGAALLALLLFVVGGGVLIARRTVLASR
jgi:LPXTG-motif cell wall-anchored protein